MPFADSPYYAYIIAAYAITFGALAVLVVRTYLRHRRNAKDST